MDCVERWWYFAYSNVYATTALIDWCSLNTNPYATKSQTMSHYFNVLYNVFYYNNVLFCRVFSYKWFVAPPSEESRAIVLLTCLYIRYALLLRCSLACSVLAAKSKSFVENSVDLVVEKNIYLFVHILFFFFFFFESLIYSYLLVHVQPIWSILKIFLP